MVRELWSFFLKKLRKRNGLWWAVAYTYSRWRYLRSPEGRR